jgi:hypothetical protein
MNLIKTDIAFENISDEQMMELNGGWILTVLKVVSTCITIYGIYEMGKDHIYDYNYNKAYKAEMKRLNQSK